MIWSTILGALVPVASHGIQQLITKWTGGVKPVTVDEQIKLEQSEIERMKAIALLDTPIGQPSQWVVDLRASARYVGALAVIAFGVGSLLVPELDATVKLVALEAANIAFGFLFGSRIVAGFSGLGKK